LHFQEGRKLSNTLWEKKMILSKVFEVMHLNLSMVGTYFYQGILDENESVQEGVFKDNKFFVTFY